ncbi:MULTISPECIES: hypothetical protein [unclassified Sinorhizobium]|uniref:hypothetical protein n=1 Tax=unclassified Sinorhizobium TaxID=2613772 RepID=UPI0035239CEB
MNDKTQSGTISEEQKARIIEAAKGKMSDEALKRLVGESGVGRNGLPVKAVEEGE